MTTNQIPPHTDLNDGQFITIAGPDQLTTGYQYDQQQRALYFKESQVLFPSFHGLSHVAEDPIPNATCNTSGLMSSDDKCKLDALTQTKIGVVGFSGGGHPDDGGWMTGPIILAAGTEFISIERIGNVIRFTCDSPIPLYCSTEECAQIFWVQDETDIASIRPPISGGKLPGVNSYGELKVYLMPESTIADPTDAAPTLNNKSEVPAFIFKRYDDSIIPGCAELECVLKRDSVNKTSTEIGWAFTPGATGVVENVLYMGKDDDGNQIRFKFKPELTPGLLGAILYNDNVITKRMGVITDYTSTILSTNQYTIREWDVDNATAIGDAFTATNVWQYDNPESTTSGSNPQMLILDSTIDLLPIGTLVDLWSFKAGEISGEPIYRHYFSKRPSFNPNNAWMHIDSIRFGDTISARGELSPGPGSEDKAYSTSVSSIRTIGRDTWGITGFDDPFMLFDIAQTAGTESAVVNTQHVAEIDTNLPGLVVNPSQTAPDNFSERPVWIWNRTSACNWLFRALVGRPDGSDFTPIDVVLRADIDEYTNKYMYVLGAGYVNGLHYIRVCGVQFDDLPPFGTVRIITNTGNNEIFNYTRKFMFPTMPLSEFTGGTIGTIGTNPTGVEVGVSCDSIVLAGEDGPYKGAEGDIVELLHQEYSSPVVRFEFSVDPSTGLIEMQVKSGMLDMGTSYEEDTEDDLDDYVRGLAPGYAVSAVYSQAGTYTGIGTQPEASPDGFVVLDGGAQVGGTQSEYWNKIEIMLRDDQIWVWWNELLIPPNPALSAGLPTPVSINTPYFPIQQDEIKQTGKVGMRLWPGAKVRSIDLKSQLSLFNEFVHGCLTIE